LFNYCFLKEYADLKRKLPESLDQSSDTGPDTGRRRIVLAEGTHWESCEQLMSDDMVERFGIYPEREPICYCYASWPSYENNGEKDVRIV
jgi:hypothetical protein